MRYQKEDVFHKDWKEGARHGAYLLHGAENYLIEKWAGRLCKQADGNAFNLHRFEGKRLNVDALYEAVEALPLMAEQKCVLIDDLDWKGMPAQEQEKFAEILSDLPQDCLLVATAKAPGFDTKLAGSKKLIGLFDKAGCVLELGSRGTGGQVSFLKGEAKKHGCTASTDLCRHILETCDTDMLNLRNEMRKVCAFAGGGELTRSQVDAVCTPRTEARVFDLSKAILTGNITRAMELLDSLFYLRESAVMILAVLIRAYVDLYRARVARDEGKSSAEMAELFGYKGREFLVRNAFSSSAGLSAVYLRHALNALYRCDRQLKSTSTDDRVLLEQTVVQLFVLSEQYR